MIARVDFDSDDPDVAFVRDLSARYIEDVEDREFVLEDSEASVQPPGVAPDLLAGRYRLLRLLGEGRTARVYEADDLDLDERVAIKVFRDPVPDDPEEARRFRREVKISRRLGHPNITRVYEFDVTGGRRFLTMELLEGCDLGAYVQSCGGRLEPADAVGLLLDAASALQTAHAASVLHRDLKPANLYVVDGRLKILDFGLAGAGGDPTKRAGTPRYMPPEALAGAPLGPSSDLYSLGICFYDALTGRRSTHPGRTLADVLKASLGEGPPPAADVVPGFPLDLSDILGRMTARNPEARFADARKLESALLRTVAARSRRH